MNKEGKPWDWMQLVETRSAALNLSETDHPWVGRPNIHMRGCSRQLSEKNFIHSLADLRWAEFCVKMGMSYDQEDVPVGLFTDLRHGIDHQLRGGNVCLLGGSLAYWHARDRTCAPVELLRHQGYGHVITSHVAMPVDQMKPTPAGATTEQQSTHHWAGQPKKKRAKRQPRKVPNPDAKVTALAGQAMNLADVSTIHLAMMLSINAPFWEKPSPTLGEAVALLPSNEMPVNFNDTDITVPQDYVPKDFEIEEEFTADDQIAEEIERAGEEELTCVLSW